MTWEMIFFAARGEMCTIGLGSIQNGNWTEIKNHILGVL